MERCSLQSTPSYLWVGTLAGNLAMAMGGASWALRSAVVMGWMLWARRWTGSMAVDSAVPMDGRTAHLTVVT
jgi:hypothetical protein